MRFTDAHNDTVVFDLEDGFFSASATGGGQTWQREPMAISYRAATLYSSHDGLTLTAIDGLPDLTVLRYQQPSAVLRSSRGSAQVLSCHSPV